MSDTGRRVTLRNSERARVLDELAQILARAATVEEHLEVAAARSQSVTSVWTEDQLNAMIGAARRLRDAVERAPLDGD